MKISSIIGSVALFLLCVVVTISGLLWYWPEATAKITGFGPYDAMGIALYCTLTVIAVGTIAWIIERMFERVGKAGLHVKWRSNKRADNVVPLTSNDAEETATALLPELIKESMRLHYGGYWKSTVRILLVHGEEQDILNVAPGLARDLWQESDGYLLIYAGNAHAQPDNDLMEAIKQIRPRYPINGIVHVLNISALPTDVERDAFLRYRQKADYILGWQAPVWLWLTDKQSGHEHEGEPVATGALFGPGATSQQALSTLDALIPRLGQAGLAQVLANPQHNHLLSLSLRLQSTLKASLGNLLSGLMQGNAAYRLRGVMFSSEKPVASAIPHTRLDTPGWKSIIDDCGAVRARKLTFDWFSGLRLLLLAMIVLWGAGTLLSLCVNRVQIDQTQETARLAAETKRSMTDRLRNQLILQQDIARLQHHKKSGAPWYTRFGLNQDGDTLAALWPLYARNNTLLMRDATADFLRQQLNTFVQLPPASNARAEGTQHTYNLLKSYLMISRPDKVDAEWLAKNILVAWPERQGVAHGAWKELAPKLLGFYAQNLPAHPQWKIIPDSELIASVRQILLKQVGQRNAESALYQEMLKRVANNWPDFTLADMTGDTDASTVFSTEEVVPGMFTRQAWEEQVQDAIDEVVKTRRDEIDWVLTDKTLQPGSEIAPEALKARLTERYFTDFGNAWLTMLNSIQWQDAASLAEAIAQLNLIGDVRQSPLVALMNTLNYQGKTGQKGDALADTIVDSAKKLIGKKRNVRSLIDQTEGPGGPLDGVFGPLIGLMEGKEGTGSNGNLSFQSWLARVTQVRLKLQQVTTAPDPQAMSRMLAQTVFQGKAIDLTDTRDYGSLISASLGQEWNGFGQAVFVQPLELAWRQVLAPATGSLNTRWQSTIVEQWNKTFAGRYPFKSTGSDASLPMLAQFLRSDSGRITAFLKTNLGGILYQEGSRWVVDPAASQGMEVSAEFLNAVNALAELSDIVFAQGEANIRFELMARPSQNIARMQLTLDEQNLDFFNQMESWKSFSWPGNTFYPGVTLNWRSVNSGMQLYANNQGNWGFIRLLDKAQITYLDASRIQLVWKTPDGNPLKFIMRSEMGEGPLALLKLQGFKLPDTIFTVSPLARRVNSDEDDY